MTITNSRLSIMINTATGKCPAGEKRGNENSARHAVPVLSCEGACIRGEIARRVANILSKKDGYARGCHGELLTVPDSAIAQWIKGSEKVVIVDGCFLKCHGRIFENILDKSKLISFDALSYYGKYSEFFDIDAVPEEELKNVASEVAQKIFNELQNDSNAEVAGCKPCQ